MKILIFIGIMAAFGLLAFLASKLGDKNVETAVRAWAESQGFTGLEYTELDPTLDSYPGGRVLRGAWVVKLSAQDAQGRPVSGYLARRGLFTARLEFTPS